MASALTTKIISELTGLGAEIVLAKNFTQTTIPTRFIYQYMVQATADVAEALALGDVATEQTLIIIATSKAVEIDLDFVSSFDSDFTIPEGEMAVIPQPAGVIYFKNSVGAEQCTIEYLLSGT